IHIMWKFEGAFHRASVYQRYSYSARTFVHSATRCLPISSPVAPLDLDPRTLTAHVERKRPLLEPLVQEPEPVPVPQQQLDPVLRPVVEHEDIARERIVAEPVPHQRAQPVVRPAEVDRVPAQKHPVVPAQAQHLRSRASSTRRRCAASNSRGTCRRYPDGVVTSSAAPPSGSGSVTSTP